MRQALARENICTAEELKKMNVWTFMNRNNLYSISERQNVLSKVRQLLTPPQPVNEENLYKLYCGEAVYCGETPSQAFVRFCEYAAGEYPLFFRSLFDRKFAGAPVAYICRSGEGDEFIKMENPTCFVDAQLTSDEAVSAAEWICRQCGEAKTVYIKEPEIKEEIKNKEEEKTEAPLTASKMPKILNGAFLAYTRPSRAFYNGESLGCSTWSDLYTRLVRKFYRAHGEKFHPGMSFYNDGKADFGSSSDMFSPEEIADGLFLECFYPPAEIVGKIHYLTDYCSMDASGIVVEYKKRDGSTARQSIQTLWEKCTAGAASAAPEIKRDNVDKKPDKVHVEKIKVKEKRDNPFALEVEKAVRDADMDGISSADLCKNLHGRVTAAAVKAAVEQNKRIAEINGKLYHEDAFVDWEDGARDLCAIAEKLMQKNDGYVSSAQLYDYARSEMNMFLNDNDMNGERSVFDMARHLFEKNSFNGKSYSFAGKTHISKKEDAIGSIFDIICKFAEEKGGVFEENELESYLEKIGVKHDSLHARMKINLDAAFFLCGEEKVIYAKSMNLDSERKENIRSALNDLFNDVGDHIILREIHPLWYERLPHLPENTPWNALLLQSVLLFFGKEFGARTIAAMEKQNVDTIHAMLVKNDSPIQTFADAVAAYFIENDIDERHFEAEELRQLLIEAKMIHGSELFGSVPKALAKDERFAWDAKGENVTIRV